METTSPPPMAIQSLQVVDTSDGLFRIQSEKGSPSLGQPPHSYKARYAWTAA
jgi:hypothetical protein